VARVTERTFLELNKIAPASSDSYRAAVEWFESWALDNRIPWSVAAELDLALVEFFEEIYFAGHEGGAASALLAALEHFHPTLAGLRASQLPRARSALKGFKRLAPGYSRAPLPWLAVLAMIGAASFLRIPMFPLQLALGFWCYLRPSELTRLTGHSLVAPVPASGIAAWALLLAPSALGRPSKTKEFDESILLDMLWIPGLHQFLMRLKTGLGSRRIFPMDYLEFLTSFRRCAETAGVAGLAPHPYSLRHGGASHDVLYGLRPIALVKRRGRWKADSSVRRYEKHARVLREIERLPAQTVAYAQVVERRLVPILSGAEVAPRPPVPPRMPGPLRRPAWRSAVEPRSR